MALKMMIFNTTCIKHCIKALKTDGRMSIIIPDTILHAKRYQSLRSYLMKKGRVKFCLWLPRQTFKSYTTARTCLLHIEGIKRETTNNFPFVEIQNDGFSDSTWREPITGNDIPKFLINRHNLEGEYPTHTPNSSNNFSFLPEKLFSIQDEEMRDKDGWELRELVEVKQKKTKLERDKEYFEPRISSAENTIEIRGKARLGKNIKQKEKVVIQKGDLVISTLHTQKGRGLFAISNDDKQYLATSQLVCRIKEDKVSKDYLVFALRLVLPKIQSHDLVGRETYTPDNLLSLKIPYPPKNFSELYQKIKKLENNIQEQIKQIEQIEQNIKDDILYQDEKK